MSTFFALLERITTHAPPPSPTALRRTDTAGSTDSSRSSGGGTRNNPHATPTPVDAAAVFRLVQEQLATYMPDSPAAGHRAFLRRLIEDLEVDAEQPPREIEGVTQDDLDALERVPKRSIKPADVCAICADRHLEDEFPLVVRLPCDERHRFDLECVAPWLLSKGTCPLCREAVRKKAKDKVVVEYDVDEDADGLYG